MAVATAVLAAVSTITTLAGGRAAAKGQAKQAAFELQRQRQQYLQYRQQGLEVLDEMLKNSASVNAYAGAGGIDAASGSADRIATLNLAAGVGDLITSREGGEFALRAGSLMAEQGISSAEATQLSAFADATGTAAAGISSYKQLSE